ncbi:hypothetical protein POVWA2_039330 [Plasmodium ovale wallikeri]|uniref:Uncharacterized protein n=1 Tax=Plasmodium ovale wallikeri TaxID=864142 RepID=A0A1A8Z6Z7_PLAOA|nr:hypothetical protein POVWA1_040570 [Plasmodium ovale wallikeri]SBT40257.1 hypothetical protein POVWA2_039330 [Plasmodium ovale wallikeri]
MYCHINQKINILSLISLPPLGCIQSLLRRNNFTTSVTFKNGYKYACVQEGVHTYLCIINLDSTDNPFLHACWVLKKKKNKKRNMCGKWKMGILSGGNWCLLLCKPKIGACSCASLKLVPAPVQA